MATGYSVRSTAGTAIVWTGRLVTMLVLFALVASALVWRAVDLQIVRRDFLKGYGKNMHLRVVEIPAYRGNITDRNGEPLAISTPVDSVWVVPKQLLTAAERLPALARLLDWSEAQLLSHLQARADKRFVYLKRQIAPALAGKIKQLDLPGLSLQREYRRYYPAGEVTAQVVGFTDIDDVGRDGVELVFNDSLRGVSGRKRVVKDLLGQIVEDFEGIRPPQAGKDLRLSLDRRIQFIAYRELKSAMTTLGAKSGSIVLLDARNGEILAMVNQPSFNPNDWSTRTGNGVRNRAVTDVLEPGSTIKPFTIAAALMSGNWTARSILDTSPGYIKVGGHKISDHTDLGRIDVTEVIRKSSNVGATKMAMSLPREDLWRELSRVGFGQRTGSGLPAESAGKLRDFQDWYPVDQATLAFGYGLSVTTLQLARAYLSLANHGQLMPVSIRYLDRAPAAVPVIPASVADDVARMLTRVVEPGGTGTLARIPGYRVAGKTGTVHKAEKGGYAKDRYTALFAGFAPASEPRLVAVVVIDQPNAGHHFGGQAAAPIFARVVAGALRLMNVAPDMPLAPRHQPGRNPHGQPLVAQVSGVVGRQ